MRAIGLLSFGYVPFIIIVAIVVGAFSYVFSVFEVMDRFTSTYLTMGLLQASILYASLALVSSIVAPALIFIKRKTRSEIYRASENYFLQSLIFFGSLFGLIIALLYTYVSIQLSRFYTLDLATLMAYMFQFIVLYHVFTISWALLRDSWKTKERTLKTVFYFGLSAFALIVATQ
ncbi:MULTISPECIES: hypothetical protein [Pseudoalteromonas]|uniref:hypothetical protein n=1 Tax=Pseudoalteromonas TaxID=53246 RepID=UPI0015837255|nr:MULTISPECIES: hypothetical protein [Pseudoalteromonas]MDI4653811.1 hypothetical protein [Pseudoalteromonas shioyasakiensis]NUJ40021.1 hypothetical protein [Pseudoalteromonas sp. 0303]